MRFKCIACGWRSDVPVDICPECGRKDPFQKGFIQILLIVFLIGGGLLWYFLRT